MAGLKSKTTEVKFFYPRGSDLLILIRLRVQFEDYYKENGAWNAS